MLIIFFLSEIVLLLLECMVVIIFLVYVSFCLLGMKLCCMFFICFGWMYSFVLKFMCLVCCIMCVRKVLLLKFVVMLLMGGVMFVRCDVIIIFMWKCISFFFFGLYCMFRLICVLMDLKVSCCIFGIVVILCIVVRLVVFLISVIRLCLGFS